VARTRSPEVQKRNDAIYAQWQRGASLTALGADYGISRQVVGRIVASYHPEEDEDDDRSLYRGYMWRLYDEVQDIAEHPGFKMAPNGRQAEGFDGVPAVDTNVQVQAKELQLKIIRELRLLDARDKPAQQNIRHTHEVAVSQMQARLAEERAAADRARLDQAERQELEMLRRRASVIPGTAETVRELPAAGA
jgi:hypothetical protein